MALQMKLQFFSDWFQAPHETSSCNEVMGLCTAHCKMLLFCVKIIKGSHNFEIACQKKENQFWLFGNFWFGTFVMLFGR